MKTYIKIGLVSMVSAIFISASMAATVPFISTKSVKPNNNVGSNVSSSAGVTSSVAPQAAGAGVSSEKVSSDAMMPYYRDSDKTYTFDQTAAIKMLNSNSTLIKVNCDTTQIFKNMGFNQGSLKINNIGLEDGSYDYNFDLRNCSFRGNKRNNTWSNKSLTEEQALKYAKDFIKSSFISKKIYSQYGSPIVMYRNSNNPRPYYDMKAGGAVEVQTPTDDNINLSGVEIDPNDTGNIDVQPEYTSFTILFPYLLNGRSIYNSYGTKVGITMEVTSDGVNSINAQLLPFKAAARNAEKLLSGDFVKFVQRGGNSPFRGQVTNVTLNKPERVLVLFGLWRNNVSELYLSSGIKFGSDIKADQRAQQPYEMIISDYKIGNSNYGW